MEKKEWELRKDICEVARRLHQSGFMAGSDGNLSTILNQDQILITPSRLSKGYLEPYQLVIIDRSGKQISGDLPPSVEATMHLTAYEERPDICSVVHCHPPILVAFTVAGHILPPNVLPEIEVIFGGEIPLAPYATPGGPALAHSIRPYICKRTTSVVLLDHHGVLAVGQDIYQASIKVEHAEEAAKVIFYARLLGGEKQLPSDSVEKLRAVRQRIVEMESDIFTGYCISKNCNLPSELPKPPISEKKNIEISDEELEASVREIITNYRAGRI